MLLKNLSIHIALSLVLLCFTLNVAAQNTDTIYVDVTDTAYVNKMIFPSSGCTPLSVDFNSDLLISGLEVKRQTWDFGDGLLSTDPRPRHTYVDAGTFSVVLTVTDINEQITVFVFDTLIHTGTKPRIAFDVSPVDDCASTPFRFINRVKGDYTSLIWYFGDGDTSSRKSPVHVYVDTGWMSPMLWVNNNGCVDSLLKLTYVHVKPPVVKMKVGMDCDKPFERTFTARFVGDEQFTWDFGDGTTNSTDRFPVHNYAAEGKYQVRLSATNKECSYIDTFTLTVVDYKSPFTINAANEPFCRGNTTVFTAANTTFLSGLYWDFGDGILSDFGMSPRAEHIYTSNGVYNPTLHVVDVNGCGRTIGIGENIEIFGPVADFEVKMAICTNYPEQIVDASVYDSPATTFYLDFGDGESQKYSTMPVSHIYQTAGVYDVFMKVRTENGCTDSVLKKQIVTVIDQPVAAFDAGSESVCLNGTVGFVDQSSGQQLGRTWIFPGGFTTDIANPEFTFTQSGNQKVKLVIGTEQGCMSTVEKLINVMPLPTVTVAERRFSICLGQTVSLQANGAATYSWAYDASLSCIDCPDPEVKPEFTTIYRVTGTDLNGCTNTDSAKVTVTRPFTLYLPERDTLCSGKSKQLKAVGGDAYSWTPIVNISNATISNPVVSPTKSITYTLVAKDTNNCFSDTAQIFILVANNPKVEISDSDITISNGSRQTIHAEYSPDVVKWHWDPPTNLTCTDCPEPQTYTDQIVNYQVTAFNQFGCSATDYVTVKRLCSNETVFIPNTFSPNGDNHNDYFYPRGTGLYKVKSMRVFNRWGQNVFEKTNFLANDSFSGWDGRWNSKKQPSGVYLYIIEIICNNGTTFTYKGDISLL